MTYDEVLAAVRALSIEDMARLKHELPDIIFHTARSQRQAVCQHPTDRLYEMRRGDRSVDVICRDCGKLIDYHGD